MLFSNFREACLFYKFPGSHQVGSFGNKTGIIRSYSNGTVGKDFFLDDEATVLYRLKDEKYKEKFSLNIKHKQLVRVFRKVEAGVKDLGEYKVVSFEKSGHVKMRREKEKNVSRDRFNFIIFFVFNSMETFGIYPFYILKFTGSLLSLFSMGP